MFGNDWENLIATNVPSNNLKIGYQSTFFEDLETDEN